MTGWKMYNQIHQFKESGFRKANVATKLGINVKTVSKYWEMTPQEFYEFLSRSRQRLKYLDKYEKEILDWLKKYPDISSAQIFDWLKERHLGFNGKERTVRDYVKRLREHYNLPKKSPSRQYQAIPDGPLGFQAQVDMGEKLLFKSDGTKIKLYCVALVLSHSRYKYAQWSDRPLNTAKLVDILNRAFEYFGGIPKQLVFDQDKIVAVSENYGDIIYTHEFERYRQELNLQVHLCRGADPESKGRVEAVVKYVKNNYAAHRTFVDLNSFNDECLEWLSRTGNSTVHGITKKIPAEVFALEKQYLQPISPMKHITTSILSRGVRKDNTILYESNRYSVPLGTYRPGKQVNITFEDDKLIVLDQENDAPIAFHVVSSSKGQLIQNSNHLRDRSKKIEKLYDQVLKHLGNSEKSLHLLTEIKKEKPRYFRDQLLLIDAVAVKIELDIIEQAVSYCLNYELWSAVDFRDATEYFLKNPIVSQLETSVGSPTIPTKYQIKATTRDINDYVLLCGGGQND